MGNPRSAVRMMAMALLERGADGTIEGVAACLVCVPDFWSPLAVQNTHDDNVCLSLLQSS
jgi:hypothetical protein